MVYTTHYRIGQRFQICLRQRPQCRQRPWVEAWRSYPLHGRLRNAATLEPSPGSVRKVGNNNI